MDFLEKLKSVRVVPVIVLRELDHAVPLAQALVEGGLEILEITLRSPVALDAIRAIAAAVPQAVVGAGTVINAGQFRQAAEAGARFVVSPGLSDDLVKSGRHHMVPLLPGVVTATEIMRGLELGLSTFKFFPAETSGGAPALKALAGPFAQVNFCPTGGISPANIGSYLALPNVVAVGGSWMVPSNLSAHDAFTRATALSREARKLAAQ